MSRFLVILWCAVLCVLSASSTPAVRMALRHSPSSAGHLPALGRASDARPVDTVRAGASVPAGMADLVSRYRSVADFDRRFPRERVFLHLDNNAYFQGETLWLRAYVVRSSSLCAASPADSLSRVLYVDLLSSGGQLIRRQLLEVDSLGQAEGSIKLDLPIRSGFYEVKAFTRAMTNWGEEAAFSRVVPVFERTSRPEAGQPTPLRIERPEDDNLSTHLPRKYSSGGSDVRRLTFYPEGGSLLRGTLQRVAYQLTDGRGRPASDSLVLLSGAGGDTLARFAPLHEGRGLFTLPPLPAGARPCVQVAGRRGQRFPLPAPRTEGYSLSASASQEGVELVVARVGQTLPPATSTHRPALAARQAPDSLLGLMITCRDQVCWFDTLSLGAEPVEFTVPAELLSRGVHCVELFAPSGRSLARRLVWQTGTARQERRLTLSAQQNEAVYQPYQPVVLSLSLHDAQGRAAGAERFSLSVRGAEGEVVRPQGSAEAQLLLCSEVRGYVDRPEQYFPGADAPADSLRLARLRLDLLLLVQGWMANSFERLSGAEAWQPEQFIEHRLTLRGHVYEDRDARRGSALPRPQADVDVSVHMYDQNGVALEGQVRTAPDGGFAFVPSAPLRGDFYASLGTSRGGRRFWSRVCLDRWPGLTLRPLSPLQFELRSAGSEDPLSGSTAALPSDSAALASALLRRGALFAWQDTIPMRLPTQLREAQVKARRQYHPLHGSRYTWRGGEQHGMTLATLYYNIEMEYERWRDAGLGDSPTVWELLSSLDRDLHTEIIDGQSTREPAAESEFHADSPSEADRETAGGQLAAASPADAGRVVGVLGNSPYDSRLYGAEQGGLTVKFRGKDTPLVIDNGQAMDRVDLPNLAAWEVKSLCVVPIEQFEHGAYLSSSASSSPYGIYLYMRRDAMRFKPARGYDRRTIQGFTSPARFYSPDYRSLDLPDPADQRRTLLWQPSVQTDQQGQAQVVLYNSSLPQAIHLSVHAVTPDGRFIDFER